MEKNKRNFTTKQFRKLVFDFADSLRDIIKAKKEGWVSRELQNHINLAVTEVNGCSLCSYKHTKDALEMGMPDDEIKMFLSGNIQNADDNEAVALMFAQHYAETGGYYSQEAWQRVVVTYGEDKAKGILGNTKAIMFGNAHGIALGSLGSRLKGKPVVSSKLKNELGVVFSILIYLPAALMKSMFMKKKPSLKGYDV
jgi:AhpD family alkylhydroperoxidase